MTKIAYVGFFSQDCFAFLVCDKKLQLALSLLILNRADSAQLRNVF